MFPILVKLGPLTIHTYGFFLALGALAGLYVLGRLAASAGLDRERVGNLAMWGLLTGILGSRLFYVFLEPAEFVHEPWRIFYLWEGGLVFYGGIIGGLGMVLFLAWRWKIPLMTLLDCFAPGVALGQFFGRLGCFSAGCCFGEPCDLPWAVTFTDPHTLAPPGVPLHPTQLYTAFTLLAIFLVLLYLWPRRGRAGRIFFTYGLLHGTARIILEQFRADFRGAEILGPLTPTALVALGLAVLSAVGLIYLSRSPKS
ncbi:MAG: prolipoprotein diacylglyceryl transferase [Deltaproteobacteria bacterium]|nr:prolipoprotein diacylglyceryl transferase [Deltaproteobacteria bacterium]